MVISKTQLKKSPNRKEKNYHTSTKRNPPKCSALIQRLRFHFNFLNNKIYRFRIFKTAIFFLKKLIIDGFYVI